MNRTEVADRLRALRIPERTLQGLRLILRCGRWGIVQILRFAIRHLALVEMLVLGCLIAILLAHVPVVGHALAWAALILSVFVGLVREVRT